ncbi:MAG: extracellular solute-binding protein [Lachnospiraceae bacterium]|nr:extracellular solute-binding protein [Lachnospiraceae bacterium]
MKRKKVAALFMALCMASSVFAGCGASKSNETEAAAASGAEVKKVSLTVWGPQEDQAPMEGYDKGILPAMCDAFNEAHPEWDISFEYGVCSEGDAKDVVTKDVDAAADVYMFANDQIPVLAKAGAIAKLGGQTAESIQAGNPESMTASVTYKDGLYGVPFTSNTWFMYYDKSKYSEEDIKSLDTMMAKDLGADVKNFGFALTNSWYIEGFYFGAGCTLFGDGTDASKGCDFDSEAGVAATKYMVDLAASPKFLNEQEGSCIAAMKDGKLAAYCSGSWDAKAIKEALGKNFAVCRIPTITINGTEGQMRSFAGSKAIGVNPKCENPEVAVALAAYLGGEECQLIRYQTRGIIPTLTSLSSNDEIKADTVAVAQMDEIENASFLQPVLDEMGSYWVPAETMGKEIIQGDVTADNAAEKTKSMVEGILSSGLSGN